MTDAARDTDSPRVRLVPALLVAAFWLLPGHPSLHPGPAELIHPLNLAVVLLLVPLFLLTRGPGRFPGIGPGFITAFAVIALASLLVHVAAPPTGLQASYHADPAFESAPERSWRFAAANDHTRTDPRIDFRLGSHSFHQPVFPIYFYNDWRHHSLEDPEHRRRAMFSARWRGYIRIPPDVERIHLEAVGGQAVLRIDGRTANGGTWHRPGPDSAYDGAVRVLPIAVSFARTPATEAMLRLRWDRPGRTGIVRDTVVPGHALRVDDRSAAGWNVLASERVGWILACLWLIALIALILRYRPWPGAGPAVMAWLLFVAAASLATAYIHGKSGDLRWLILAVGDDYLVYEGLAREILSGDLYSRAEGPLIGMNFGYRYLVALVHLLVGESPAMVLWFQIIVMLGLVLAGWAAVRRLYGERVALVFVALAALTGLYFDFARQMLDTTFAIGFGGLALYALLSHRRKPSSGLAAIAGCAMGCTVLLRANLIAFVPIAVVWMLAARNRLAPGYWREPVLFLLLCGLLFGLVGVRNLIVSGEIAWMPASGTANLWVANHPPEFTGPTYFTPMFPDDGRIVARVIEHAAQAPLDAARRVGEKAAFVVGFDGWRNDRIEVNVAVVTTWLLALLGLVFAWRDRVLRADSVLLLGWIAAVVLPLLAIFPWGYGWRLQGPAFAPLYLLGAIGIARVLELRGRRGRPSRAQQAAGTRTA